MEEQEEKNKRQEVMFGKEVANAISDFNQRIERLKKEHSEFLEENNIDFDNVFTPKFSAYGASYEILNEDVIKTMGNNIKDAYELSFKDLLNDRP